MIDSAAHDPGRSVRADGQDPGDFLAPLVTGGEWIENLLRNAQFFSSGKPSSDHREVHHRGGRETGEFWLWHERWRHDKVVRSSHGVHCTGSRSWKIYAKDGIIAWGTQQTDYPSGGPDSPEYEPHGCPPGASFSWFRWCPDIVYRSRVGEPPNEPGASGRRWRRAGTRY